MKTKIYQSISLVALALFYSCSSTEVVNSTEPVSEKNESSDNVESTVPESQNEINEDVDAAKFKELIENGDCNIVDVRTPEEFTEGSINGAVNINFNGDNFENEIGNLDRNKPVLVYCQAGGRSGKAKDVMINLGFKEIYNLVGGYGSWPYK